MDKIKAFIASLKARGIDITMITLRDVKTKEASITFTFFVITMVTAILALFDKTKLSLQLGLNFENCKELVTIAGAIYFGRKLTSGSTNVSKEGE